MSPRIVRGPLGTREGYLCLPPTAKVIELCGKFYRGRTIFGRPKWTTDPFRAKHTWDFMEGEDPHETAAQIPCAKVISVALVEVVEP